MTSPQPLPPLALPATNPSLRIKLVEFLRNLQSPEIKIYSDAAKDFISLLSSDSGDEIIVEYVRSSPNFSEIFNSWKLRSGKPGLSHILSLTSAILNSRAHGTGRVLDDFARAVLKEKLEEIYGELSSPEHRRQIAALYLLASIVKRGMSLASEVTKVFDFKSLAKFTGSAKKRKLGGKEVKSGTRRAFVKFAVSFLEVGNPKLLRLILQQREVYFGVLRGLASDDEDTVVHVLTTLESKILTEESLIPPGLRSVLFGSVTLEQLSSISGNSLAPKAAEMAHKVLITACTDPSNGLMPGLNLRGNEKRLFELMKTLKATEETYHKELVLAIASMRPSLCSMYMDEFPYNLEPRPSSLWFSAISLAADMIASVNVDLSPVDNAELQSVLKCILPHTFSRAVINRGLLYKDVLVKHGSLRILFESLKSLSTLIRAIDNKVDSSRNQRADTSQAGVPDIVGIPGFSCFPETSKYLDAPVESETQKWVALRQYIEDEVRAMLPDPQTLLNSWSQYKVSESSGSGFKKCTDMPKVGSKKQKIESKSEDVDIVIGGMDGEHSEDDSSGDETAKQELGILKEHRNAIAEIWGLKEQSEIINDADSDEKFFHSKLLDVVTFYFRTVPLAFEGSFDFFKLLPPLDPLSLSLDQQQSSLSLLVEYIGLGGRSSAKAICKHLQAIINIFLCSQTQGIRDQAFILAKAAMISTGAFDQNLSEVDAWLLSLPGYYSGDTRDLQTVHEISSVVVSFLCEAVSTVGNQLHRYLNQLREQISKLDNVNGNFPGFSPLVICVLEKCLRLLEPAGSGAFTLHERSMISLYVSNTLHFILQIQDDKRTLSGIFHLTLGVKFNDCSSRSSFCEWRPLRSLLSYELSDLSDRGCKSSSNSENGTLSSVLSKTQEFLENEHDDRLVAACIAFLSSVTCAAPNDVLNNFPLLLTTAEQHFASHLPFLSWVLFLERDFLPNVIELWPDMFIEPASTAFGNFLYHAPFYALFSATMRINNAKVNTDRFLDMLRSDALLNLFQQKLSEHSLESSVLSLRNVLFWAHDTIASESDVSKELFRICVTLVGYILDHLLAIANTSGIHHLKDVVDFIFQHPIVSISLLNPTSFSPDNVDDFLTYPVDSLTFRLVAKLFDFIVSLAKMPSFPRLSLSAPKKLVQNFVAFFREKFVSSIVNKDVNLLLPGFYMFRALVQYISPFDLLELVHWMLGKLEDGMSTKFASICFYIADDALSKTFDYIQQPSVKSDTVRFDAVMLPKIYVKALEFGRKFDLECADKCLLKVIDTVYRCRFSKPNSSFIPLYTVLSRTVIATPVEMIAHCLHRTTKTKANILSLLIEISPTHMKLFGRIFLGIISDLSEDDLIMLLPSALSYLTLNKELKPLARIPKHYSTILLNGFSMWKSYVIRDIFQEECNEIVRTSLRNFERYCSESLLGKAVIMLRYFFTEGENLLKKKQRLKIFESMYPHPSLFDELLNEESLRVANNVIAKVQFTRLLLFPEGESTEKESKRLNRARLEFLTILVNSLDQIVKNFSFRYLERFILRNIIQLSVDTRGYLTQLTSIPFLNQFIRSSLLHRFDDPYTLKTLRHILVTLSEAKYSFSEVLALLIGHSQFVPTIIGRNASCNPSGALLQTFPTLLRSLDFSLESTKLQYNSFSEDAKLELVKLLRVLYHLKCNVNVNSMNSRELLSLLLSGYNATLSEVDLEIYHLMNEIESTEGSDFGGIAEWDYMWGASAIKLRKELNVDDCETVEERRKMVFRENVPVESKVSVMTILHFCNDRASRTAPLSLQKLLQDNFVDSFEKPSSFLDSFERYDPAYILRFAIHSLLMGYLEPVEFSRLGLLAITLRSISSPDNELRRLGYESLGNFKSSLENYQGRKDVLQLKLLLTYIQNGITEEFMKIPSVVAIFAAEASLVLLDPSQNQFFTLSKYLMHANKMNIKRVPLFPKLFRSGSIHFRTERLWILRLLYAGLNSDEDAKIYIRNNFVQTLLGFYASSLSDLETNNLILQVLKKGVRIPTMATRLIQEYGLIPWLSSIVTRLSRRLDGNDKQSSLETMELVLKIFNEGISSKTISKWLQEYALEQLSELSSHLHTLVVKSLKSLRENISLVGSLLNVMVFTLKISQKRKSDQPHFTISIEGLYQFYKSVSVELNSKETAHIIELALDVILMSAPVPVIFQKDRARLSKLITLAIPAALQSFSTKKEQEGEESLASKLLRWVTASVITGSILKRSSGTSNLFSLVEAFTGEQCKSEDSDPRSNETLLVTILYLQQFLGQSCSSLPSVVCAACLLLLRNSSTGIGSKILNENAEAVSSLCLNINCPPEVNPAWRWSYYQPWRELSSERTELELLEEEQTCRSLLTMLSNALFDNSSAFPALSHKDLENFDSYNWKKVHILES